MKKEWDIYIRYALSGCEKHLFTGTKTELMTLIGCIHSTSLENCSVRYIEHQEGVEKGSKISYTITSDERICVAW